jgi:putative membrane protein
MSFVIKVVATSLAVWLTSLMPLGIVVEGGDSWWGRMLVFLSVGFVIAALNALVRPVVSLVTLPVQILTLGLFTLVIGWFILWLAAWISESLSFATLEVGGFWQTLFAALIIAIISGIANSLLGGNRRK